MPDSSGSRGRKVWIFGCLLVLLVVGSAAAMYWLKFLRGWTVASVDRVVRAELPTGSTREDVEAFLKRHGFKHSFLTDVTRNRLDGQTVPQRAGLSDRDLGGMVEAFIADANVDVIYRGGILIYFLFDREGRLVGHVVYPWVSNQSHMMGWLAPPPSSEPYTGPPED